MSTSVQDLGLAVRQLQWRHERRGSAGLAPLGVSLPQWNALRQVDAHPEASLRELAVRTFQTEQAMGTLAGRMEERGLIARGPAAGRAVRLVLTAEGRRLLDAGGAVMETVLTDSFAGLAEAERADLLHLLQRALDQAVRAEVVR